MNVSSLLISRLKTLRLSGILESLDVRLEQARSGSLGYREFLELIVQDETERREATRLNQRLKKAAFEEPKAIEGFEFAALPGVNIAAIKDLATGIYDHIFYYQYLILTVINIRT